MDLTAAGLQEQPFRTHGKPVVFVGYAAQEAAFDFLEETLKHEHGLALFRGPPLSGKTTIMRQFADFHVGEAAVAVVDGAGMNTSSLLEATLRQFGYEIEYTSVNELLAMLKVFALQQTATGHPPMLIIENTHDLNPSALNVVAELASLEARRKNARPISAIRLVLSSDRSIADIIDSPAMEVVANRVTGQFQLTPLGLDETTDYIYAKFRAGGCFDPENVIPEDVCDELHIASGGWPGVIDRLVLLALAKADYCPLRYAHIERPVLPEAESEADEVIRKVDEVLSPEVKESGPPRIILTKLGATLRELSMDRPRLLIGRSEHNDLCINSKYVSRHHALLVRHGAATFLMDLNSTNGTYVNSRRVSNQVLIDQDIISIGNHGIKFIDPAAQDRAALDGSDFSDTVIMKSLEDMRKVLARENTQALPVPPEVRKISGEDD